MLKKMRMFGYCFGRKARLPVWMAVFAALSLPVFASRETASTHEASDLSSAILDAAPSVALSDPVGAEQNYEEVIRAIEAYPDVAVFPVPVQGPLVASSGSMDLGSEIAQSSKSGSIAVIYPDIGEPYHSVFEQILNGIEDKAKGRVSSYAVGQDADPRKLGEMLRRQGAKVVIALGRQGMKVASNLNGDFGVVVGGVLSTSQNDTHNIQVNSLCPDPALLFSHLKAMMPGARKIYTVYDPRQNAWIMRLAMEAARVQGLQLVAYQAQNLRSAMQQYRKIFAEADASQDALWLPQDTTTVEEGTVLPMVLQESWTRNLAVFSSTFGHVRRGILFSLYPNNVDLGKHLAGSALGFLTSAGSEETGLIPLREVLMAINLRTAKHLGIDTRRQLGYALAFPEQ